jgi:hypothetical protein
MKKWKCVKQKFLFCWNIQIVRWSLSLNWNMNKRFLSNLFEKIIWFMSPEFFLSFLDRPTRSTQWKAGRVAGPSPSEPFASEKATFSANNKHATTFYFIAKFSLLFCVAGNRRRRRRLQLTVDKTFAVMRFSEPGANSTNLEFRYSYNSSAVDCRLERFYKI